MAFPSKLLGWCLVSKLSLTGMREVCVGTELRPSLRSCPQVLWLFTAEAALQAAGVRKGKEASLLPLLTRLSLNQLETGLNYSGEKAEKTSWVRSCPDLVKPVYIRVYAPPAPINPWITACV